MANFKIITGFQFRSHFIGREVAIPNFNFVLSNGERQAFHRRADPPALTINKHLTPRFDREARRRRLIK
jgi:hypothetical protein